MRQGGHQGAQKSTRTGPSASRTSDLPVLVGQLTHVHAHSITSDGWTRSGPGRYRPHILSPVTGPPPGSRVDWVRTPEALASLLRSLDGCRALALDSESDSLHHHFEKVCLVQLASDRGEAWLIDPLALRDLRPLAPPHGRSRRAQGVPRRRLRRDHDEARLRLLVRRPVRHDDRRPLPRPARDRPPGPGPQRAGDRALQGQPEGRLVAAARSPPPRRSTRSPTSATCSPCRRGWRRGCASCGGSSGCGRSARRWRRSPRARREADPDAYLRIKGAATPQAARAGRAARARRLAGGRAAAATDMPAFKVLGNEVAARPRREAAADAAGARRGSGASSPAWTGRPRRSSPRFERARELPERDLPVFPRVPRPVVPEPVRRRVEALKAWRARDGRAPRASTSRWCCPSG